MKEWIPEIEQALFSMDILVALLTGGFRESDWTDQEIGVAIGRRTPIIPVHLGKDPYGFIGKYQAIVGRGKESCDIANDILLLLLASDDMRELGKDAYLKAVARSFNFKQSNLLGNILPTIDQLSTAQAVVLVNAFNGNHQVRNAWNLKRRIAIELYRMTGHSYELNEYGDLVKYDLPF